MSPYLTEKFAESAFAFLFGVGKRERPDRDGLPQSDVVVSRYDDYSIGTDMGCETINEGCCRIKSFPFTTTCEVAREDYAVKFSFQGILGGKYFRNLFCVISPFLDWIQTRTTEMGIGDVQESIGIGHSAYPLWRKGYRRRTAELTPLLP